MTGNIFPETEWEKNRLGSFTSSQIYKLFTEPKTKSDKEASNLSETAKAYINEKASEILTGTVRQFTSSATEWGCDMEPRCIELLKKEYPKIEYFGNENKRFFKLTNFAGGSPDAVHENLVFEIKCPENPANHIEYLQCKNAEDLKREHKDYYYQLQMNMAALAKHYSIDFSLMVGYFVSYCPIMLNDKLKLDVLEIMPDFNFYNKLTSTIEKAEAYLLKIIEDILNVQK